MLASLETEVAKVEADLAKLPANTTSRDLVKRYVAEGGWHRMDLLHRRLEGRLARMEEEPETEKPLNLLRAKVENAQVVGRDRHLVQRLRRPKVPAGQPLHCELVPKLLDSVLDVRTSLVAAPHSQRLHAPRQICR